VNDLNRKQHVECIVYATSDVLLLTLNNHQLQQLHQPADTAAHSTASATAESVSQTLTLEMAELAKHR